MPRESLFRTRLPVPAASAFAWHERRGAFERLSPPWRRVRVIERAGGIGNGARVTLDLGFPLGHWRLEHYDHQPGRAFHDRQLAGPFAHYVHAHRFHEAAGCSVLEDRIDWGLPLWPLSAPAEHNVRHEFERLFAWRHRVTRLDLERVAQRKGPPLTIGVTGASGFLGRELCAYLSTQGHRVRRFVRGRQAGEDEIAWDPARGQLEPAHLAGLDAVIHLAGAGIADAPWTAARKAELVESRVRSTDTLARALARATDGPRVLVSTSAIGAYGDRGEEWLTESSATGHGFLAELAQAWEGAAAPARDAGLRVVHPRIGIVLSPQGGALAKLALPYHFGLGGPLGDGRAWWSWIGLHDLLDTLLFAIETPTLSGVFNAVAPEPVRQRELAGTLGGVLARPAFAPAPAFALRALLGREQADAILLASQRVRPSVLQAAGFVWRDPVLEPLLARVFGRAHPEAVQA
jgi:uncharacterized protein (TIGR01777 family)